MMTGQITATYPHLAKAVQSFQGSSVQTLQRPDGMWVVMFLDDQQRILDSIYGETEDEALYMLDWRAGRSNGFALTRASFAIGSLMEQALHPAFRALEKLGYYTRHTGEPGAG